MTDIGVGTTVSLRFRHALNTPVFLRSGHPLYDQSGPFVVEGATVFDPQDGFEPVVRVRLKGVPGDWLASRFVAVHP